MTQQDTPLADALKKYKKKRILRFDVPGHKGGRGNSELWNFFGKELVEMDFNSSKPLDNLSHPTSVIKDAEHLAAEAFGVENAFFMVNGTSSSVQAMIMSACKENEKIILPRNIHKSAINALIINGAIPIYVKPGVSTKFGVSLGISIENVVSAIKKNCDAKAVFVNNPTYYGFCSNIKEISKIAHENNMLVLADEAHGTHFYFNDDTPVSAMKAGADMAAVSIHKTGGSLTQSSLLLSNGRSHVRQIIDLMQTTSASYILLSSIDIARKNLSIYGNENIAKTLSLAEYARKEIEAIGTYKIFDHNLINGKDVYDFDLTKLSINTCDLGLAGIEVYEILRDEYDIQVEFGDMNNILAIVSHADRFLEIERFIGALFEINKRYKKIKKGMFDHEYIEPIVEISPKKAFYSEKTSVPIDKAINRVSGESLMCYPPGIPVIAPGEVVTREIVEYIRYAKAKGCLMTGTCDMSVKTIMVI